MARKKSAYRRKIHAYARTEIWHERSRRFRASRAFICAGCGLQDRRNHAHHLDYSRAFSGTEPDSDLMCLCSDCHRKVHAYVRRHGGTLRAATYAWLGARR
jgi:5-methylcytosine-specific restriction endonuclease McrA